MARTCVGPEGGTRRSRGATGNAIMGAELGDFWEESA